MLTYDSPGRPARVWTISQKVLSQNFSTKLPAFAKSMNIVLSYKTLTKLKCEECLVILQYKIFTVSHDDLYHVHRLIL